MKLLLKKAVLTSTIASLLVTGCAATQSQFISSRYALEDTKVCRNYLADKDKLTSSYQADDEGETDYIVALRSEFERRNLNETQCENLVKEADEKIGQGVLLGILAVGAAAAASSGGYSNGYSSYSGQRGYAWDQFKDGYGSLTWRCRDKGNGRFAYNSSCAGQYKNDYTWPGK